MNREELEERQLEIANRMKNIIWTVCGDYTLEAKPDVEAFLKSKYIALYDGIKQGAFAKYFEKEKLSMYLVKKVYLGAREDALVAIAQLCMEKAVGDRIARERKGVSSIQKKAYEYVLDHEMDMLVKSEFGRLQLAMMRQVLTGERRCEEKIRKQLDRIEPLEKAADTMEVIRTIDDCYNAWVDPGFEQIHGDLSKVLAVTGRNHPTGSQERTTLADGRTGCGTAAADRDCFAGVKAAAYRTGNTKGSAVTERDGTDRESYTDPVGQRGTRAGKDAAGCRRSGNQYASSGTCGGRGENRTGKGTACSRRKTDQSGTKTARGW